MTKEEIIEERVDIIQKHFEEHPPSVTIRIPYMIPQTSAATGIFSGSWALPTTQIQCYDITYEDFINHTKRKVYNSDFDKLVNE